MGTGEYIMVESPETVPPTGPGSTRQLGKLPVENGYAMYPKFKQRKVSAVRDFPPGCGPLLKQISMPNKEVAGVHTVEDKNDNVAKSNGGSSFAAVLDSRQVNAGSSSSGNVLEKISRKNYPPRRRISAVRDFPPSCGRIIASVDKEQSRELPGSPKKLYLSQVKASVVGGSLEEARKSQEKAGVVNGPLKESSMIDGRKTEIAVEISSDYVDATNVGLLRTGDSLQVGNAHVGSLELPAAKSQSGNQDETPSAMDEVQTDTGKIMMESVSSHRPDSKSLIVDVKGRIDDRSMNEKRGKEIVVYEENQEPIQDESPNYMESQPTAVIVYGLMAAQNCPWCQKKGTKRNSSALEVGERGGKKCNLTHTKEKFASSGSSNIKALNSKVNLASKGPSFAGNSHEKETVVSTRARLTEHGEQSKELTVACRSYGYNVSLPPFGCNSSSNRVDNDYMPNARQTVRETLRLFQAVCRKLLQEQESTSTESKSKGSGGSRTRIDFEAVKILKGKGKSLNTGISIMGAVPGVEVGDEFHYRMELHIIGVHRPPQGGIDYMKHHGMILATSIVASGGYDDDLDNSDFLIYTGSGGNGSGGGKEPADQKLERGNLALKNSMDAKNPVRVIRGFKETKASDSLDMRTKGLYTYIYDGLYIVERYWQEPGPYGKLVFKYQLGRLPGQPELAWKKVRNAKKYQMREGLCADDISQGKEKIPICAVNTIDNEKPPPFTYVTQMIYPDRLCPIPPKGCDCRSGCRDSNKCSCAVKNGGEIPYNYNGAIVEAKQLVFECGPNCGCPPSCRNRVTQYGIRFQLEIFKTEQRGWGVRSLSSIPSGSFICEYIGELLEDREAEQRIGNDEYLFDIGSYFNDSTFRDGLSTLMPETQPNSSETVDHSGFTIDAAQYGNIGRFINHSCSPNLYAQNVLYDHEDKRIPHVMLFAAENIPPLQELTYHYNYTVDEVRDSDGSIKKKYCYCGSSECSGRLY